MNHVPFAHDRKTPHLKILMDLHVIALLNVKSCSWHVVCQSGCVCTNMSVRMCSSQRLNVGRSTPS